MAEEPVTNNELEETEEEVAETPKKNDAPQGDRPAAGQREQRPRERRDQRRSGYRGRHQQENRSTGGYQRPGRFHPRRKVCMFCADKVKVIDWKNVDSFRRFTNNNGSIRARRKTGTCAKHQRQLAVAIKRARYLALTPYTDDHVRLYGRR